MADLILHIGMGRCGSTSIQAFAAGRRGALRARGIDYPSVRDMGFAEEPDREVNGDVLFRASRETEPEGVFSRVIAYAATAGLPVLVSSEGLFTADHAAMGEFRRMAAARGGRLRVIAYVREQADWVVSRWSQGVKMGWTRTLADCLERPPMGGSLHYPRRFEELAGAYGRDAIEVGVFAREGLAGGDVRTDLFHRLGVDVADLVAEAPEENVSPAAEVVEAMRLMNLEAGEAPRDHRPFLAVADALAGEAGVILNCGLHRLVAPRAIAALRARYAPLNEAFRADWLPDLPAPLFASARGEVAEFEVDPLDPGVVEAAAWRLIEAFRADRFASRAP